MKAVKRWCAGRTPFFALLAFAGIIALVGALANQSRLSADDPPSDRILRPMGPEDQRLWADDSLVRLSGGGGGGVGKESRTRDAGDEQTDRERKPDAGACSCTPTGR